MVLHVSVLLPSLPVHLACRSRLVREEGARLVGPVLSGDSCETLVGPLPSQSHFVQLSSHLGILRPGGFCSRGPETG